MKIRVQRCLSSYWRAIMLCQAHVTWLIMLMRRDALDRKLRRLLGLSSESLYCSTYEAVLQDCAGLCVIGRWLTLLFVLSSPPPTRRLALLAGVRPQSDNAGGGLECTRRET